MRVLGCACCLGLVVSAWADSTDTDCANWDVDIFAPPTETWCYIRLYRCADHYDNPDLSNYNVGDLAWAAGGKKLGAHTCAAHGKFLQIWRVKVKRYIMRTKPRYTQCKNDVCGCGLHGKCGKKTPEVNVGWRYKFPGKLQKNSKRQFSLPKGSRKDQWEDLCLERVLPSSCVKKLTYNEDNMAAVSTIFKRNVIDTPIAGCRSLTPINLCTSSGRFEAPMPSSKEEEQECQARLEEAERVEKDEEDDADLARLGDPFAEDDEEVDVSGDEQEDTHSDSDYDALSFLPNITRISIPSEAIHHYDGKTYYTIVLSLPNNESIVQASRRYSEFDTLREELTLVPFDGKFPRKQAPDWACQMVKSLKSCVEDRRLGLEAFLNRALQKITQAKYLREPIKSKHWHEIIDQADSLTSFLTKPFDEEDSELIEDFDEDSSASVAEKVADTVAKVSEESSEESSSKDALIKEYYDTNMGVCFTMVSKAAWGSSWGLASSPSGKRKFVSIMTHKQDMSTYQGNAYGLIFHITPESGFWKYFLAIKSGKKAGGIVGGPGDGGSHTTPSAMVLPESMGKDYKWFHSEKMGILGRYNTVYKIHDYNEFITLGTSKNALAGIFHYTNSRKFKPSDAQMCRTLRNVRGGRWPVYAYDRRSLKIERYLTC